ncbi:hypothetical protein C8B47_27405 [filamentous cyanobacterium CCP4]|nr:hypothetical protein C8B47_27405 [filamentous cyanobacterium CCP4]
MHQQLAHQASLQTKIALSGKFCRFLGRCIDSKIFIPAHLSPTGDRWAYFSSNWFMAGIQYGPYSHPVKLRGENQSQSISAKWLILLISH